MSRRGATPSDPARWVFNRLAADYRARPGYPPALVARLLALAGGPGARIADLGAGTGLLALPLARAGARVHAVEPARAMLDVLAEGAGGLEVVPVHAAAEETGLPGGAFDLVLLADALQWVDPERAGREVARLLAPGGALAVVVPRLARTPFLDALAALLAEANPKARPAPPPVALLCAVAGLAAVSTGRAAPPRRASSSGPHPCSAGPFARRSAFGLRDAPPAPRGSAPPRRSRAPTPPAEEIYEDEVLLEPARLDAVLRSLSFSGPALGPARLARLLEDARALAASHGGARWRREIALFAASAVSRRGAGGPRASGAPPPRAPRAPPRGGGAPPRRGGGRRGGGR